MRITVWSENYHEQHDPSVAGLYPEGLHGAIASGLSAEGFADVRTATQDQPDHGLSDEVLGDTDVLFWWGHVRHHLVDDEVAARVVERVRAGMGLVVLHSGMESKVFTRLMGTSCRIDGWRHGDRELVWTAAPGHPIADGIPNPVIVPAGEMYCEPFDIPQPHDVVFINSFSGGEVFRSGVTFLRGLGRIFYFSPGHEDYPVYHQPEIRRILANAARWASPKGSGRLPQALERDCDWYLPTKGA